ncbi:MAG: hypothetical protein HYU29_03830 [Chloroflexi bacterium]|nr:hypothetical protein [Chloroflexota bacterium]
MKLLPALQLRLQAVRKTAAIQARVPEINLMPPEYLPKPFLTPERRTLLLLVLELLVIIVLFRSYGENTTASIRYLTGRESSSTQEQLRADQLTLQINTLKAQVNRLNASENEVATRAVDWPPLLKSIFGSGTQGLEVFALRESLGVITLSGATPRSDDIVAYREYLLQVPNVKTAKVLSVGGQAQEQRIPFTLQLELKAPGVP